MSHETPDSRLAHAELSTPGEMAADCRVVGRNLRLEKALRSATAAAPSIRYEDYPTEVAKREIRVSDAAARLAGALHLHLD